MIVVPLISLEKRMTKNVFSWLLPRFVKTIHVELANEAINIPMAKIVREDYLFELINIFYEEFFAIG